MILLLVENEKEETTTKEKKNYIFLLINKLKLIEVFFLTFFSLIKQIIVYV